LAEYAAAVERNRAPAAWRQDGYYWSTAQSAAVFAAIIVVALIIAGLLAVVIEFS
jgi:hypothetical protein